MGVDRCQYQRDGTIAPGLSGLCTYEVFPAPTAVSSALAIWRNWPSVVDMVSSLQTIYVPLLYESIQDESRG
jgi:hypothetical protein